MPAETADLLYPVLPLRDIVAFPAMKLPLFVGRPTSLRAVEHAVRSRKPILLIAQKTAALDEPCEVDLHPVGTLARILEQVAAPNGTVEILVEGISRARLCRLIPNAAFAEATIALLGDAASDADDLKEKSAALLSFSRQQRRPPLSAAILAERMKSSDMDLRVSRMQELLEADLPTSNERLRRLADLLKGFRAG